MKKLVSLFLALVMVLGMVSFASADEMPKLRVAYPGNIHAFAEGEDENHNFIIDYIEEGTGIDVEWILLPTEDPKSKLNMMLISDEVDVVFNSNYSVLQEAYNNGLLMNLYDLIPEGTLTAETEELSKMAAFNGEQFAVRYPGGESDETVVWTYNKKLTDAAGIVVPEKVTLDDFTDILYKIKEAYPDKFPLTTNGSPTNSWYMHGTRNILAAFGIANLYRETADGGLECTAVSEDMREFITYMNKLYTDGILDPEYMVNTKDTIVPKIINEQVVSVNCQWYDYTGTYSPYMIDEEQQLTDWQQVTIIYGDKATTKQTRDLGHRQCGAISATCQDVESAIKLLAFMSTEEYYYRVCYGVPGVDSNITENGVEWLDTPVAKCFTTNGTFFHNYYNVQESKALRCWRLAPTYVGNRFQTDIMNYYEPKEVLDPIAIHPTISEYDDIQSDMNDIFAIYLSKMIVGDYTLEQFDEMIAEYEALGGVEAERALSDWYKNK